MDLHIRSEEAQRLAVELAEHSGEPVELAVTQALRETLARRRDLDQTLADIAVIQGRVAAAIARSGKPVQTQAEWDAEIYDEWGLPR